MRLLDMSLGIRAGSLMEALPTLPLPATERMPQLQQEPSARKCTEATVAALQAEPCRASTLCAHSLEARHAALAVRPRSLMELHRAAVYLGIPLRRHPELLWIASALYAAQLPLGWFEARTAEGTVYYYCPALGCAQWEHPAHCHLRGVAQFFMGA